MQTAETKPENIPQKSPKKIKTVQCKVVLLDGTEYSCDLEVRDQVSIESSFLYGKRKFAFIALIV